MYQQVAGRMVAVYAANFAAFTQAVAMAGGNAITAEVTCYYASLTGGTSPKLRVTAEESNDLENWNDLSAADSTKYVEFSAPGYGTLKIGSIASQYVRLKLAYTGGPSAGTAIIAAGVNSANL